LFGYRYKLFTVLDKDTPGQDKGVCVAVQTHVNQVLAGSVFSADAHQILVGSVIFQPVSFVFLLS
jgi:hypothetical protein